MGEEESFKSHKIVCSREKTGGKEEGFKSHKAISSSEKTVGKGEALNLKLLFSGEKSGGKL